MVRKAQWALWATCVCATLVSTAAAAADDIVLYASDASNMRGNWRRGYDSSAAGGQFVYSADKGWNTTSALASPKDYVEFQFAAPANTPYRVWFRLRASGDSKYNDSVFAQFSDARNAVGAAIYRIGTSDALTINLQACNGCALSGWGWLDGAYWLTQSSTLTFSASTTHTLRVQTREDGVIIDQVVLSPATYLTSAPGQAMNDKTIVAKIASPTPTSTPFTGTAVPVPGTIQAENFDNGAEGVAYHDTTAGNSGGSYRQTRVDIEPASDGGYNVGWISPGEWLNYSVNVAAAGAYLLEARVASSGPGGVFHVELGATNVTGSLTIPDTGDWQAWTTISKPVTLAAGVQIMRLVFESAPSSAVGNINWVRLTSASTSPTPTPPPPTAPAPSPTPIGAQVRIVNAGGDLQAALNAAQPGDTILLQAGATFTGNFILPAKGGSTAITIRSSAADASLPAADVRITPAHAAYLPKIKSPNTLPAMATAPGAHHYTLVFLEFLANAQGAGDILALGDGDRFTQNTIASVPHDLIVDRVYIHGDPLYGQKRGIGLNSASTSILNSYIAEIKADGQDSQAIAGWNGPGPYAIVNNYLEAASENLLIGGADPGIPNLVPSDITIRQNYLTKQLAWRAQPQWNVKNLLELKNAQRVVIDGNVLEYSWEAAQSGYAVMLTPRNQDGTAPWSVVQSVKFVNNVVRHAASGINILGTDNEKPSQVANDILIRNNLWEDISSRYGGEGRFALINGGANITFDHNTVIQDGWTALYADGQAVSGFVFTNNIIPDYSWAIMGGNTAPGNNTIATYFPNSQFFDSVFIGSNPGSYPTGNYYPATMSGVGFVDAAAGDYRLSPTSIYRNAATDGTDVGCNITTLNVAVGTKY